MIEHVEFAGKYGLPEVRRLTGITSGNRVVGADVRRYLLVIIPTFGDDQLVPGDKGGEDAGGWRRNLNEALELTFALHGPLVQMEWFRRGQFPLTLQDYLIIEGRASDPQPRLYEDDNGDS